MKPVFVDANVLLEIISDRRLSEQCINVLSNRTNEYVISALTVHIVRYISERDSIEVEKVSEIFSQFEILPITSLSVKVASLRYKGRDFEDCLQAACAEEGGCGQILTIDKNFQKHSSTILPVSVIA